MERLRLVRKQLGASILFPPVAYDLRSAAAPSAPSGSGQGFGDRIGGVVREGESGRQGCDVLVFQIASTSAATWRFACAATVVLLSAFARSPQSRPPPERLAEVDRPRAHLGIEARTDQTHTTPSPGLRSPRSHRHRSPPFGDTMSAST